MDVLSSLKSLPMSPGRAEARGQRDLLAPSSTSSKEDGFSKHLRQPPEEQKSQAAVEPKDSPVQSKQPPGQKHVQQEIQDKNVDGRNPATKKEEIVDSIPRRIALQTFIRKMKDEVGVDAQAIMKAFGSLSSEELALPPEQNMQRLLGELDLSGEQQLKAQNLFGDLLKQTASNSLADHLKASGRQLSMEVLSDREVREKALKESLAQMNENFFVAPPKSDPTADPESVAPAEENEKKAAGFFAESSFGKMFGTGVAATGAVAAATTAKGASSSIEPTGLKAQNAVEGIELPEGMTDVTPYDYEEMVPSEITEVPLKAGEFEGLPEEAMAQSNQPKKVEQFKSLEEQLRGFKLENNSAKPALSKQAQSAYEMLAPKAASAQVSAPTAEAGGTATTAVGAGIGAALGGLSLMSDGSDEQAMDDGGQEGSLYSQGFDNQAQAKDLKAAQGPKFELTMQPTPQEESSNIKELINQAQFLSKKGGGEMKVALTPDGLGEVQMKVAVKDGSVNVEMLAESNEAKKLLEKGLGDLKATLASHKLNVENIKVDFQGEITKHFEEQQRDAERQFQQQFLENFRQENGGFRRSFADMGGLGGSSLKDKDETEARLQTQSVKPKRSDKRLDLVA